MALISKKKFEEILNNCLAKFCDKRIIETREYRPRRLQQGEDRNLVLSTLYVPR